MVAPAAPSSIAQFFQTKESEVITADQLQDAIIRRVEDIERVSRALSKVEDPFLQELSEVAATSREKIESMPAVTLSRAPIL